MKIIHRDCAIGVISTNTQASAALGVIRFTGFTNIEVFSPFITVKKWKNRFAHFVNILDESFEILDEGIAIYFKAPASFTGENILELQLHGNPLNLQKILNFLCDKLGFEKALPGEFTYRAFKNGKLNLSQVEGLDLLLNTNSGFGLSAANKMLSNELYKSYLKLREQYIELRSAIEIAIDFSEDVGPEIIKDKISKSSVIFDTTITSLFKRCQGEISDLLTPSVTLFGKTNAGKSTLFNSLLGNDRAIVSDVHGTTRDFVSEYWDVSGFPFRLIDTAGLRETQDFVEKQGISRSISLASESFFKILVVNPYQSAADLNEDIVNNADAIVFTHLDLLSEKSHNLPVDFAKNKPRFSLCGPMGAEQSGSIGPLSKYGPMGAVFSRSGPMGAKSDGPVEPHLSLEELIVLKYQQLMEDNPIAIQRHRDLIKVIYSKYQGLKSLLEGESDIGILSYEINMLGGELDELLGIVNSQEVLDHIFSNFCIGK